MGDLSPDVVTLSLESLILDFTSCAEFRMLDFASCAEFRMLDFASSVLLTLDLASSIGSSCWSEVTL